MISWDKLARMAWDALQPPDPNSLGEKVKRGLEVYEEVGAASELANEVLKLSDPPGGLEGEET